MKHKNERNKLRKDYEDLKLEMGKIFKTENENEDEDEDEKYSKLIEMKEKLDEAKFKIDYAESTDPYRNIH